MGNIVLFYIYTNKMNVFRTLGDILHAISKLILLLKIFGTKNVNGLSLKTQYLYCIVYICRYCDLFSRFSSYYNTFMKTFLIVSTLTSIFLIKFKKPFCKSYNKKDDTFNVLQLLIPCSILSMFWNVKFTFFEILWSFSMFLESVAIIPQMCMVCNFAKEHSGNIENLIGDYIACIGAYRFLYALNWIYRSLLRNVKKNNWDPIIWTSGFFQIMMYSDFLFHYLRARLSFEHVSLPV